MPITKLSATTLSTRIESSATHATQNGSGRQVVAISHRELVPGEPPKTARVLRLLSKRQRKTAARGHKRGNQVRPPPQSIEVPYSAG